MTHIATRMLSLTALAGAVALASCGSDSTSPPLVDNSPQPGHVYIYAGTGNAGYGSVGQVPSKTRLYWPQDVAFAPDGSPVVIDWNNHRVIEVDQATGKFKLLVGVADGDFGDPCPGPNPGSPCNGIVATQSKLNHPTHVAFDGFGHMVLCAWHNSELFVLDTNTGLMDRICGNGIRPCNSLISPDPQAAISACVDLPCSVAYDPQGRICFTDQGNMIVRRIDGNTLETIAGTPPIWDGTKEILQFGFSGDGGPATSARVFFENTQVAKPSGKICFDPAGNMYIADTRNHAVRVVDTAGNINRFAGLPPVAPGNGQPGYSGDGGLATEAMLNEPRDVASDADGNIYIADTGNNVIRMVKTDGIISTIVGVQRPSNSPPLVGTQVLAEDGKSRTEVNLTYPSGIEVDSRGRLWIADTDNNVIRILYR
jgi:sugar lactone lactonase YvrE